MFGTAQEHTVDWADVAVIAPPSHRNVTVSGHAIVRGIEINPPSAWRPRRTPGMGSIGALQTRLARRRQGSQIATDVTGRQAQGSHASDLEMSEVLTYAAALLKERLHG